MSKIVTVIFLVYCGLLTVSVAMTPKPCIAVVPSATPVPVVSAASSPSPTPDPGPTERVTPVLVGTASTYGPGFDGLTAVPKREWRGKHVEICYADRCVVRVVNDLGPDQRVFPDRVVDLDVPTFEYLAQGSWRVGLLYDTVTVRLLDE